MYSCSITTKQQNMVQVLTCGTPIYFELSGTIGFVSVLCRNYSKARVKNSEERHNFLVH